MRNINWMQVLIILGVLGYMALLFFSDLTNSQNPLIMPENLRKQICIEEGIQ